MKRKITTIILVVVTLGILFFYNSNSMVTLDVNTLPENQWTLGVDSITNDLDEAITAVYSVDLRKQMVLVPLDQYFELLKSTTDLTEDISLKRFYHKKHEVYKGYHLLKYKHLSEKMTASDSGITLEDNFIKIDLKSMAYGTFKGGVSLPDKVLDRAGYDIKDSLKLSLAIDTSLMALTDKMVFKALFDSTVVLNNDVLMAILPSFEKEIVGFIEIRK